MQSSIKKFFDQGQRIIKASKLKVELATRCLEEMNTIWLWTTFNQVLITIFITSETRKTQYDNLKGPIVIK